MQVTVTDFWVIEEITEIGAATGMEMGKRCEVVEGPFGLDQAMSHAKGLNYTWSSSRTVRKFHVASTTRQMVVEITAGKMIEDMMRESGL